MAKEHAVATGLREQGLWLSHPHAISYVHFTLFRWKHERYDWASHNYFHGSVGAPVNYSKQQRGSNFTSASMRVEANLAAAPSFKEELRCGGPQPLCFWPAGRSRRRFRRSMPNITM